MKHSAYSLLLLVPFVGGCLQTLAMDRSDVVARMHGEMPQFQCEDKEIAEIQAMRPQLKFPCRIAVYIEPSARWTGKDKEIINSWGEKLRQEGIASDFFLMGSLFVPQKESARKNDMKEVRLAAARHGADALLILMGNHDTSSYLNPAAVLNLTVVGGFVIPASHRDTIFLLQGALIDVNNGFLYASGESEGNGSIVRPTFIVEDKAAIDEARRDAVTQFGGEFIQRLRSLRNAATPTLGPLAASK